MPTPKLAKAKQMVMNGASIRGAAHECASNAQEYEAIVQYLETHLKTGVNTHQELGRWGKLRRWLNTILIGPVCPKCEQGHLEGQRCTVCHETSGYDSNTR